MRKILMCLSIIALVSTVGVLKAQEKQEKEEATLKARPVQIISCDDLPSGLDFQVKPMGYKPGFQIYYLLEGNDLIGIKKDSLVLDSIKTAEGTEISKTRTGKSAYKQGPFPKVSEDGRYGMFSIEVKQNQFRKVDGIAVKGTITALTGSKREEKNIELSVTDKQKKEVGPFSVSIGSDGASFGGFGSGDGDSIGITITGPFESIIEVKLLDSGQELESEGAMWSGSTKTFNFSKPKSDKVSLYVHYWLDIKEVKVPLDN